ncbi:MAG: hypothetical protein RJA70_4612, partial [Pseudomonadota bacterium]
YGRREGFEVAALMFPQLETAHVVDNLRAAVSLGLEIIPMTSARAAFSLATSLLGGDDAWIGPGAMGTQGAEGFADAVGELYTQSGAAGFPEALVVAVGSGSTAAGLLVGLMERRLPCTVVGVGVNHNPAVRPMVLAQAYRLAWKRAAQRGERYSRQRLWAELEHLLSLDMDFVAGGYGRPSAEGRSAIDRAQAVGLVLEHTYTGKAFAAALKLVAAGRYRAVGFWNTLAAASLKSHLAGAPELWELAPATRRLLIRDSEGPQ